MIKIEKLKTMIDRNFKPPFLPEGMVETKWIESKGKKRFLQIKIDRRDVWIDDRGNVASSGTDVTENKGKKFVGLRGSGPPSPRGKSKKRS